MAPGRSWTQFQGSETVVGGQRQPQTHARENQADDCQSLGVLLANSGSELADELLLVVHA